MYDDAADKSATFIGEQTVLEWTDINVGSMSQNLM